MPTLSKRYDQCTFIATHNAYANAADGWRLCWGPHHVQNISQQLEAGVSCLLLDFWMYENDIYLWHQNPNSFYAGLVFGPKNKKTLFECMGEIVSFLNQNPTRVVTIFFEDHVSDLPGESESLAKIFQKTGAEAYAFHPHKTTHGSAEWNVKTQGWPTVQWMLDHNRRLVMFTDNNRQTKETLAFEEHYVLENVYGFPSLKPKKQNVLRKEENVGNQEKAFENTNGRPLVLMNHTPMLPFKFGFVGKIMAWCAYPFSLALSYCFYPASLKRVRKELLKQIEAMKNEAYAKKIQDFRAPNFIALNFALGTGKTADKTVLDFADEL